MSEFNLIEKPWISVVTDYKGTTDLVGLREFFENAHNYIALAGDMPTQDFAVMRFLLAILHTVFSRYQADGQVYDEIKVNDRMQQVEPVDMEDYEDYEDALMQTWKDLWAAGKFPHIVIDYLKEWEDRFNLFHDKYPFYQVTEDVMKRLKLRNQRGPTEQPGFMSFKTINRLISEIKDNTSIFSMISGEDEVSLKSGLSNDKLARWIINLMGYTTSPDKTKITSFDRINSIGKYDGHKGWLYAIGGLHYKTDNLFNTLLLNLILVHPNDKFRYNIQTPLWEFSPKENIEYYLEENSIDNLARLYTDYSRAIKISKEENEYGKYIDIIQLPILDKKENLLECMTIWEKNKKNEKVFSPKENAPHESMWRNFGMIYLKEKSNDDLYRIPGIVEWIRVISKYINLSKVELISLGIKSDGTSSNIMINEIYDELNLNFDISLDCSEQGWVIRVRDVVEQTKEFINKDYKKFIDVVVELEGVDSKKRSDRIKYYLEEIYYKIDKPFRDWLSSIRIGDNKDEKTKEWIERLKKIILNEVEAITNNLSNKFFTGVVVEEKNIKIYKNIATSINELISAINIL